MAERKPCLAEDWFVEDGLNDLAAVCPLCRAAVQERLSVFGSTDEMALREVYRMSRALRVKHRYPGGDWAAMRVHDTLRSLVGMAQAQHG